MVDKEPDDMVIRAIGVLARCCAGPFATEIDVGCDIARELAFNARIQHEGLRLALKAAPDPRELAQARELIRFHEERNRGGAKYSDHMSDCVCPLCGLSTELAQARERITELEQAKGVTWHAHHDRALRAEATLAKVREECEASMDEYTRDVLERILVLLGGRKERG